MGGWRWGGEAGRTEVSGCRWGGCGALHNKVQVKLLNDNEEAAKEARHEAGARLHCKHKQPKWKHSQASEWQ